MEIDIPSPKPPVRGENLSHNEVQDIVAKLINTGFGEGAVVVRENRTMHEIKTPYNWGYVQNVSRYKNHMTQGYDPLGIKWFATGSITYHWPDDLLIIYPSRSWSEMEDWIKSQKEL